MLFEIAMSFTPPLAVLTLKGELDLHTAETLRCGVEQAVGMGCVLVDVDLSEVTFIDCAGIDALVTASSSLQAASSRLRVRRPSPVVARMTALTGTGALLGVVDPVPVVL